GRSLGQHFPPTAELCDGGVKQIVIDHSTITNTRADGVLRRVEPNKGGYWQVLENPDLRI
ncbi:hypothetical protein, partial [Parabacteroides johnsonii]|uniref:hypothetical protein n=1 Tax=Parabacteroides johnsonii TaxID=387661 RepID=UPI00242FF4E7